jgi:hypothetical protein
VDHAQHDPHDRDERTRRWACDRLNDILGLYDEARDNTGPGRRPAAVRFVTDEERTAELAYAAEQARKDRQARWENEHAGRPAGLITEKSPSTSAPPTASTAPKPP